LAADWYRSLAQSGQSQRYEPSDVSFGRIIAEELSHRLQAPEFSAMTFTAVAAAADSLACTVGARQRLRIEMQRHPAEEPSSVQALRQYRQGLHVVTEETQ
jgi:hypothetical protein